MDGAILKLELQIVIKPPKLGGFDKMEIARALTCEGHTGHGHHQGFETHLGQILSIWSSFIVGECWDIMLIIPRIGSRRNAVGRGRAAENGGPPCNRRSTTGQDQEEDGASAKEPGTLTTTTLILSLPPP